MVPLNIIGSQTCVSQQKLSFSRAHNIAKYFVINYAKAAKETVKLDIYQTFSFNISK